MLKPVRRSSSVSVSVLKVTVDTVNLAPLPLLLPRRPMLLLRLPRVKPMQQALTSRMMTMMMMTNNRS
jgi:hypothetical protein